MLMSAAAFYERELERRRGILAKFLEPGSYHFYGLHSGGTGFECAFALGSDFFAVECVESSFSIWTYWSERVLNLRP